MPRTYHDLKCVVLLAAWRTVHLLSEWGAGQRVAGCLHATWNALIQSSSKNEVPAFSTAISGKALIVPIAGHNDVAFSYDWNRLLAMAEKLALWRRQMWRSTAFPYI